MNKHRLLTILSLVSLALLIGHVTDDFILGFDKGVVNNSWGVAIMAVLLCGTLLWRERIAGRIILLLGGTFALGMPLLHLRGRGYGDEFLHSGAAFRFIWSLYTLGALGVVMIILAAQELMKSYRDSKAGV